jgi:fatty acid desaturase
VDRLRLPLPGGLDDTALVNVDAGARIEEHAGYGEEEAASRTAPLIAGDVLTLGELRELRRVSGWRGAGLVLHAWAVIAAAMAVYVLWPSMLTLAVAFVVIGGRQLGLMMLAHEATHWRLFAGQKGNDRVGRWLCAGALGVDLKSYRRAHHLHHRYTGQPDDPELALAAAFPVTRGRLARGILADLSGWSAARDAVAAVGEDATLRVRWRRLAPVLASHAVLLAVLSGAGHASLYLVLWVLPLVTWYRLLSRLRAVTEHAMVPDGDDPLRNSRTIVAGPIARALLAPYWMSYHLEHHLLVFVPCWKLRRAHALLLANGYGARMETASGYRAVIRRATSARA